MWLIPNNNISTHKYYIFDFRNFFPLEFREQVKELIFTLIKREILKFGSIHRYYTSVLKYFIGMLKKENILIRKFDDITPEIVDLYYTYLTNQKIKNTTRALKFSSLKSMIKYGNLLSLDHYPPLSIFPRNTSRLFQVEDKIRNKHISIEAMNLIKKYLRWHYNIYLNAAVTIAMESGLRISEILTLQKGCLLEDFEGHPILHTFSEKINEEIYVPVSGEVKLVIEELEKNYEDNEMNYIFFKNGTLYSQNRARNNLRKMFHDIERENNVDLTGISFHSFRHSIGRKMINNGATIHQIKSQLNHKSIHSTNLYSKLDNKTVENEYFKMGVLGVDKIEIEEIKEVNKKEVLSKEGDLADGKCKNIYTEEGSICEHFNSCLLCNKFITFKSDLKTHENHLRRIQSNRHKYLYEEGISSIEKIAKVEEALIKIIERLKNEDKKK